MDCRVGLGRMKGEEKEKEQAKGEMEKDGAMISFSGNPQVHVVARGEQVKIQAKDEG